MVGLGSDTSAGVLIATALTIALIIARTLESLVRFVFQLWRRRNGHSPGENTAVVEELRAIRGILQSQSMAHAKALSEAVETRRRVEENRTRLEQIGRDTTFLRASLRGDR